jgi:hypothetical protein
MFALLKSSKLWWWLAALCSLVLVGLEWLSNIQNVETAPQTIRVISRMWWVQAFFSPLSILALMALIFCLSNIALREGWLQKLWSKQRQRFLSCSQSETLVAALTKAELGNIPPAFVQVRFARGNEECKSYAANIVAALRASGWTGNASITLDEVTYLTGLRICAEDLHNLPRAAHILADAFHTAKIDFDWSSSPAMGGWVIVFVHPQKGDA